jgi:hypothetical protein
MKKIALLACALLVSGEALAAEKKKSASGCVRMLSSCVLLFSGSGGYLLTGANLPAPGTAARVRGRLSGETSSMTCPTRLIIKGTIAVEKSKPIRRRCPGA